MGATPSEAAPGSSPRRLFRGPYNGGIVNHYAERIEL
jgi:hypothetical protein